MQDPRRSILALTAALVASAALVGCGSGSDSGSTSASTANLPAKLSSQDQQQLLDRTSSMSKELQTVVTQTVKCVKKVALSASKNATQDPSSDLKACLSPALNKAQAAYQDSSNWIGGLARRVSGSCQQKLQQFASASSAVGTDIKVSTSALVGGDTPTFQANIAKLGTAGTELQNASSGVGQSCAS